MKHNRIVLVTAALLGLAPLTVPAQDEGRPPTVEQRLDRIERLLSSQGLLDMLQQIQQLQQEVSQLRGEIEVQNHRIEQLQQRQRNLYADIDQRLQRLQSGGAAQPAGGGEGGPPLTTLSPVTDDTDTAGRSSGNSLTVETMDREDSGAGSGQAPEHQADATGEQAGTDQGQEAGADIQPAAVERASQVSPVQIQAEYQEAFRLLKQSRYDQAIQSFKRFLSAYPDSEYADNAQYWLAEAYYVTRDFESALKEYRKLVSKYPESQKVTHGLLKIGYTLQELGRPDEARQQLQELIKKYPGTTAARLADERLKSLDSAVQNETGSE